MKFRSVRVLLILVFAFWATGSGRALHERLEHSPHLHLSECSLVGLGTGLSMHSPDEEEHCHDDCAICSTLAHMSVGGHAMPTLVVTADTRVDVLAISNSRAPRFSYEPFLPSRGPPQLL
jgi:hypothetical protein